MELLVDPRDPKFGMDLEIEGSSIAKSAEREPVGMWRVGYDWDSTAIFGALCERARPMSCRRITPSAQSG